MEDMKSFLWIKCPFCNGNTKTKIYPDTVLLNFPLICCKCKREAKVDVVNLKMVIRKEPDE